MPNSLFLCLFQDPNRPKRAMSAFFLYSQANRTRVKEENPEASFGEIVSTSWIRLHSVLLFLLFAVDCTVFSVLFWRMLVVGCIGTPIRVVSLSVL